MDIGGFFTNWGNWSPDRDRNDALNQAVTLFGANMLAGSGSGRNFSSILGRSIGAGVEGFNEREQGIRRNKLADSQIEEQKQMGEYRRAQIEEMRRKAREAAELMRFRMGVLNPSPTDAALRAQAAMGGQQGPTQAAAQLAQGFAENGYRPSPDDLRKLAAAGALEATDVSMFNAYKPDVYKQGDTIREQDGRTRTIPRLPEGAVQTPDGRVMPLAGMPETTFALTGAAEEAKQGAATRHAFAQSAGRNAGEAAFRPPFQTYNPTTGAMEGVSPFAYGMEQLGGSIPGVPTMGGAPGRGAPPRIQLGPGRDDARAGENTKASDADWHKGKMQAISDGAVAKTQLGTYRVLRTVVDRTGWGAETAGAAANALVGLAKLAGKDLSQSDAAVFARDVQTFRAYANRLVADYQILQKGTQTESDAKRYEAMMVRLGNTPEANKLLLDLMEATATEAAMKGDFYRNADVLLRERRATPEQIDREWQASRVSLWNMPSMARWREMERANQQGAIPR